MANKMESDLIPSNGMQVGFYLEDHPIPFGIPTMKSCQVAI